MQFDGYRFCTTTCKEGTALTNGVALLMFFSSDSRASKGCQLKIQPAIEDADSAFLFIHHCCIVRFLFCPVKEQCWSREGGFNWTDNNDGDAHPWSHGLRVSDFQGREVQGARLAAG